MSNAKIQVPTAKVQKAYDHQSSTKSPFNKSRMNQTQKTFGGFTSKRSSEPTAGFQTSTHLATKDRFYTPMNRRVEGGAAFMTGVHQDSSIFDDLDQAICEQKLRKLRPTIGRKSSQDEVDTLKMIMLS